MKITYKSGILAGSLALCMTASLLFCACASEAPTQADEAEEVSVETAENTSEDAKESEKAGKDSSDAEQEKTGDAAAASSDRTGAKWIDSGIYGTFSGMDDIRLEDDFAAYINRDWAESAAIPDGESNTSSRIELENENNEKKIALLKGEQENDEEFTSMKNFYDLLLDWDTRNARGYEDLKPYADDIMGISSIEELNAFYSEILRIYSI